MAAAAEVLSAHPPAAGPESRLRPFLKWAGGKRQLLPVLRRHVPHRYGRYFEPFLGAGALFFDLQPQEAVVNDANGELINCYRLIQSAPEALLADLRRHRNASEYFYSLRNLDRRPEFASLTPLQRASRLIFLNKTCYNGLFRVNRRGHFNAPFGAYKNPRLADEELIREVSRYLNTERITLLNTDFASALEQAGEGDFAYLDPPYDPVSPTSSFTGYHHGCFNRAEQIRLKETCDDLTRRGCRLLLSNSDTPFIRELYGDARVYEIVEVPANRSINSRGDRRGRMSELLISNKYQD